MQKDRATTTKALILHILSDQHNTLGYDCLLESTVGAAAWEHGLDLRTRQATSAAIEELLVEKKITRIEFWKKEKPLVPQYLYILSTTRIVITNTVSASVKIPIG